MTSQSLKGKTALITGASGGIGRATARSLAQSGADLILHGHTGRDRLEALVAELGAANSESNVRAVFADLTQEPERDRFIDDVSAICFAPDILVVAAGLDLMNETVRHQPFESRLDRLWQLDVVVAIRLARCFGQRMQQSRQNRRGAADVSDAERNVTGEQNADKQAAIDQGVIILFGWDGVDIGMAGETAQLYAAGKGAVQGFARSFAKSVAPEVRVNCVAPGWIKTTWGETAPAATNERVAAESLTQRWGTAEEVAGLVRFLVSDDAAYVNNQIICVNGGR